MSVTSSDSAKPRSTILDRIVVSTLPVTLPMFAVIAAIPFCTGQIMLRHYLSPERYDELYWPFFWVAVATALALGLALTIGLAAIVYCINRSVTGPLSRIAGEAEQRTDANANKSFDTRSDVVEVQQIIESFNRLFATDSHRIHELNTLACGLMHDFGTPLLRIRVEALKLLEGKEDGNAADTILEMCDEMDDLLGLNFDIANNYGKVEKAPKEKLDLVNIVRDAFDTFNVFYAPEAGVSMTLSIPSAPVMYMGHTRHFQQILVNLIGNALKFTQPGGRIAVSLAIDSPSLPDDSCLEVDAPSSTPAVVITVSDTGRGIPAEDVGRIFDRDYRAGNAADTKGSGLGLALVHSAVLFYNGKVECDSAIGKGSTFTIHLPLRNGTTPSTAVKATT